MKNTLKNGALDLHRATVMALVQDARGRRIDETVLPTEEQALLQYFGECAVRSTCSSTKARRRFCGRARTGRSTTGRLDRSALRELARAIRTPGRGIYGRAERETWFAALPDAGVRLRAETLYAQLDVLRELRPRIKAAMIAEARRDPAYAVLRTVPFLGPVRVATLLATMQAP